MFTWNDVDVTTRSLSSLENGQEVQQSISSECSGTAVGVGRGFGDRVKFTKFVQFANFSHFACAGASPTI